MRKNVPFYLHILPSFLLITVVVAAIIFFNGAEQLRSFYAEEIEDELQVRARMFSSMISDAEKLGKDLDSLAISVGEQSETRFTVITQLGEVLADSRKDPINMDNHGDRPEIISANEGEVGSETRYSETMKVDFMYVAIPTDSLIVRSSIPLTKLAEVMSAYKNRVIRSGILASLVAILLSVILSRRISRPIEDLKQRARHLAEGKFSPALMKYSSSEINELSSIMEHSSKELEKRFTTITDQKERLSIILSGMIEGVIALDQDEKVFLLNDAAKQMLNIEQKDAKGHWLQELVRNVPFQQTVNELLFTKESISAQISVPTDGDPRILSLNGRILENQDGCLIVLHDITDIKRLENLRRDFAGNVSHELRTPLTSIKGFVETLEDGAINDVDDAKHFLGIISRQVDRLNNLIEDLLTIARLEKDEETGGIDLIHQDLTPIARQAISFCRNRAEKKEIEVILNSENDNIKGEVSESLLQQAFANLIDNAIKYSDPQTKVTVSISDSGDYTSLSVADEGFGIPKEHLSRLFERFYRVDKARSSSVGGTGLGLSIVKHIAGVHNGSVNVESKIGKGTTFTILLPKVK